MRPAPTSTACLAEDDLLVLAAGRALADSPAAEAHLASCATCSALLASLVRDQPAARWDNLAGTSVGPYRLDAQIGAGGMGAVYRAWDPRLERVIAIKLLHAAGSARIAAEARAAAAISHPNVVAIHDVGTSGDITYVAMELVDGESLRSVIAHGPMAVDRACELALDLVLGLAAAHARGVIHRDLKPENLIVASDGRLRILDFGLAKILDAAPLDETEPGTVQGTPGYMAPEQARGEPADARSDLFAVGAIVHELVTGRRAFAGTSHADRLSAVLRDTPAFDGLGPLAPIVERCLAKEPRDRFQSATDLAWALGRVRHTDATPQPVSTSARAAPAVRVSRRAVLVGAGAASLAGVAGYLLGRRRAVVPELAGPKFVPLTARTGRVFTARFTHVGTHAVYGGAWDGEPLRTYMMDLATGGTRTLELPPADVLAVSARGELAIAFDRRFVDHQSATGRLAIVPLAGGAPRPLADEVQDADFAPDGSLAVVRPGDRGFRLELPLGNVLVETEQWLTHPRVSPDGARVAYLAHPNTNDDAGDVMIVEVATRTTRTSSGGWTSIAGLAWAAADTLWFTASRGAEFNAVRAVTLDGAVRRIADAPGRLRLHDVASDGRALVTLDSWRLRTLAGGGGVPDRDLSRSHVSYVADLSADGSTLAVAELDDTSGIPSTYLVPVADGPSLRLGPGFPLAIAPSGSRVAVRALGDGGPELVAYATASAARSRIATVEPIHGARWIDDATLIAAGPTRIWRLSLSASPLALTPEGQAGRLAIDPARRRSAFIDGKDRLHVIELGTSAVTTLPGTFARQRVCGWLASPDAILVCTTTTPLVVTRIDPASGAVTPHLEIAPPAVGLKAVDSVVIHSDGVRYAYSYGQELSQLFVMST